MRCFEWIVPKYLNAILHSFIRLVSLISREPTLGKQPPPEDENDEDDLLQNAGPLLGFHRNLEFSYSASALNSLTNKRGMAPKALKDL